MMKMNMHGRGSAWPRWGVWHITGPVLLLALLGALGLLAARSRLSMRQRNLLLIALIAMLLLLASDIQALSMSSYRSHMMEHLIVILLISPIVAAALDLKMSRSAATVGFLAFTVLVPLYHLTPLGSWVMQQSGGHFVELVSFLIVGVWFWTPVYGGRRVMGDRQRIMYTTLALPVIATTGLVLWSSTSASLGNTGMHMAMITIADIHNGGLLMMLWGSTMMAGHVAGMAIGATVRGYAAREPVGLRYL
ncbi:MAG: cytochrome c oxidase assembly protein [Acidimicrobiales bacterium]